ncbi:hypothetical protein X551_01014 [Methylibium sp. T29]|nr:hypothetical protein X551_01014 [Methylibium sp. T29]EWS60543.1 hypothetical protein Y694_01716 [Methylibium sp. T29-B]
MPAAASTNAAAVTTPPFEPACRPRPADSTRSAATTSRGSPSLRSRRGRAQNCTAIITPLHNAKYNETGHASATATLRAARVAPTSATVIASTTTAVKSSERTMRRSSPGAAPAKPGGTARLTGSVSTPAAATNPTTATTCSASALSAPWPPTARIGAASPSPSAGPSRKPKAVADAIQAKRRCRRDGADAVTT